MLYDVFKLQNVHVTTMHLNNHLNQFIFKKKQQTKIILMMYIDLKMFIQDILENTKSRNRGQRIMNNST